MKIIHISLIALLIGPLVSANPKRPTNPAEYDVTYFSHLLPLMVYPSPYA